MRPRTDRPTSGGTPGAPSRRRVLCVCLAMVLAVATLTAVGTSSWSPLHSATTAGASPACQSDGSSGCTATLPCPGGQSCPTVDVAPATSLSDGQYVFIKASDFPSGDTIRIAVCSTLTSAGDPSCLDGQWESNQWGPVQVPITVNAAQGNLTQAAVPIFFDQSGEGNSPLPAHDITNTRGIVPGFYCDDSSDPCAIEVTEETGVGNVVGNGPADSSSNTTVLPLSFAAQNGGCPTSDTQIQTDSSFSLEHFLPAAVDSTCTGSKGEVALNTATDTETVASDFASGGVQLGFVDDPADASQEATLQGKGFAYIPVAVSGTAVAMLAGESDGETAFPVSHYNLTPNMVAGLLTSEYQTDQGSVSAVSPYPFQHADNLVPPLNCASLVGCPAAPKKKQILAQRTYELRYNSFDLLNPVSAGIYPPNEFGSYNSNVPNGSSYQATDWLCNAPDVAFPVSIDEVGQSTPVTVSVADPTSAPATLTTAPTGSSVWPPGSDPGAAWVYPTCHAYSTLPALAGVSNDYGEAQSPALQAKSMRTYAYGGNSVPSVSDYQNASSPQAAFGVMDSSEASFYGLNTASVQNAAGNFEAPTAESLEAAENNLSPCPSTDLSCPTGTYQVDYTSTANPTAYPMPDLTYAVVPTGPQPAAQATAEADLLTNLVTFSHNGGGSLALPSGYAPLSDALYQAALTDIANDIVAEPTSTVKSSSNGATSTAPSSTGSSSGASSTGLGESGSTDLGLGTSPTSSALPLSTASPSSGSGSDSGSGQNTAVAASTVPTNFILVSLDSAARLLLPAIVALALGCLIVGPMLLFAPALRRRRRGTGGAP